MYKQEDQIVNRLLVDIKSKIKPRWITAFVAGMIIGLLTYGYLMSNHFLTYDSMWNQYSDQNMITSGRQFLQFACGISSYYDLPWLNGLLAVFYLAVTSVFVIEGLGSAGMCSGDSFWSYCGEHYFTGNILPPDPSQLLVFILCFCISIVRKAYGVKGGIFQSYEEGGSGHCHHFQCDLDL